MIVQYDVLYYDYNKNYILLSNRVNDAKLNPLRDSEVVNHTFIVFDKFLIFLVFGYSGLGYFFSSKFFLND